MAAMNVDSVIAIVRTLSRKRVAALYHHNPLRLIHLIRHHHSTIPHLALNGHLLLPHHALLVVVLILVLAQVVSALTAFHPWKGKLNLTLVHHQGRPLVLHPSLG